MHSVLNWKKYCCRHSRKVPAHCWFVMGCPALSVYCSVSADGVGQELSGSVGADDVETLSPSHVGQATPCWRHSPHLPN